MSDLTNAIRYYNLSYFSFNEEMLILYNLTYYWFQVTIIQIVIQIVYRMFLKLFSNQ